MKADNNETDVGPLMPVHSKSNIEYDKLNDETIDMGGMQAKTR